MPTHDIVVIGGSAGAVEAMMQVVAGLPADLPAAVLVVIHTTPNVPTLLPSILTRAGALPAALARHDEPIRPGRIYIPPPDHHLLVHDGTVQLSRGPKENSHRPALDTLFRSAAVSYGPRVVGVVLSGMLDDGAAGLAAIKTVGGIAIVQNPNEALFSSMPLNAIEHVDVDAVLHLQDIPAMLDRLAREPVRRIEFKVPEMLRKEAGIARMNESALQNGERPGLPSALSCPECHGSLYEIRDGELVRFRCRVGHAYSLGTLSTEQASSVEAALWSAMVALKEKAVLARRLMAHMRQRGHENSAARFEEQVKDAEQRAKILQDLLETRAGSSSEEPMVGEASSGSERGFESSEEGIEPRAECG